MFLLPIHSEVPRFCSNFDLELYWYCGDAGGWGGEPARLLLPGGHGCPQVLPAEQHQALGPAPSPPFIQVFRIQIQGSSGTESGSSVLKKDLNCCITTK